MTNRRRPARATAEEYLKCRTWGHSWDDFTPTEMRRPSFGWRYSLRCVRCGTERHDLIGRLGDVLSRQYIYPEAYKDAGIGTKGLARNEFRRELAYRRYGRPVSETPLKAVGDS